eukprot:9500767-Pyramimonas_sp.AAC.1
MTRLDLLNVYDMRTPPLRQELELSKPWRQGEYSTELFAGEKGNWNWRKPWRKEMTMYAVGSDIDALYIYAS